MAYDVTPIVSPKPTDCGATCLKMLLKYYGIEVDLDTLIQECNTRLEGCTGTDLRRAGNAHGLDLRAFAVDTDTLMTMDRPAIIHWRFSHWCIFCGVDKGQIMIINPDRGKYHIPVGVFRGLFSGVALFNGDPVELPPDEEFTNEDIIETLADHEYRVCLLELGINEEDL